MLEKFFAYLFLACCWIFHSIWKWHELRSFLYSFSSLMYLKNETSNFQNGILLWRYTVCLIIKSTKIKRKLYVSTRNLDDFILFFHRIWKWRWIITEIILISRYYSIKVVYIYINTVQPQCLYAKIPGSHCHSKICFSKNIINIHITPREW